MRRASIFQTRSVHAIFFTIIGVLLSFLLDLRTYLITTPPSPVHLNDTPPIIDDGGAAAVAARLTGGGFMFYFHTVRIMVAIYQKTASASFWTWMYNGLTNNTFTCNTFIQNVQSPCWKPYAKPWWAMPEHERRHVLTDPTILRVAIHRDPLDRVLSCWRSKFACMENGLPGDRYDQQYMFTEMNSLMSIATDDTFKFNAKLNFTANKKCLTIEEYARMLDVVSDGIESGKFNRFSMEAHMRPQTFFFDLVNYSIVLPVHQLNNATVLKPIVDRLPYAESGSACQYVHKANVTEKLFIPENAAVMLSSYASWSERPLKQASEAIENDEYSRLVVARRIW